MPKTVNANYIASVLGMSESSAKKNILRPLKTLGLIDDEGKPTNLAVRWRDDHEYSKVCNEVRAKIYPQALLDVASNPDDEREAAKRWFANSTGAGENAVSKMLSMYSLLSKGDPSFERNQVKREAKESVIKRVTGRAPAPKKPAAARQSKDERKDGPHMGEGGNSLPPICINMQIHISSDASIQQIESIFASMSKHIYGKRSVATSTD